MSHYHCEIVMPPTDDVEAAVAEILDPFDENQEGDDRSRHAFWDWYVIGGRWSGAHIQAKCDPAKLEQFMQWLQDEKVTVSALQCGKQELRPADQEAKVDAKWNEMFPSDPPVKCPIFYHSGSSMIGDVCRLGDVPLTLKCSRAIVASRWMGELRAQFMVTDSAWNGVSWNDTKWDGSLGSAVEEHRKQLDRTSAEYQTASNPTDDWLCVTVDYHS